MQKNISIIGAGSRGTSLAQILNDNGHTTLLWTPYEKDVALINQCHVNPSYLKENQLSETITATENLQEAIEKADYLVFAVPSHALIEMFQKSQPFYKGQPIIIATKGLYPSSDFLFSAQVQHILQTENIAILSGPSHAEEVIKRMPTRVTIASHNIELAKEI